MFDPLTGRLRWLWPVGKCPGRAPGHVIGARLREGRFEREWLFCWFLQGRNVFEKFDCQSGRPDLNRRPLDPSHLPGVAGRGSVSLSGHLTRLDSSLASLGVARSLSTLALGLALP